MVLQFVVKYSAWSWPTDARMSDVKAFFHFIWIFPHGFWKCICSSIWWTSWYLIMLCMGAFLQDKDWSFRGPAYKNIYHCYVCINYYKGWPFASRKTFLLYNRFWLLTVPWRKKYSISWGTSLNLTIAPREFKSKYLKLEFKMISKPLIYEKKKPHLMRSLREKIGLPYSIWLI